MRGYATTVKRRIGRRPGIRVVTAAVALGVATFSLAIIPAQVASAATDTVTNCSGSPSTLGSLPFEVANANSGDTITFALSPSCATINLTATIEISQNLTITGPGAGTLAVSGGASITVFQVDSSATATISGLTIEDGYDFYTAGGIDNQGTLSVDDSTFTGDDGGAYNCGAIDNFDTLSVTDSTFTDNGGRMTDICNDNPVTYQGPPGTPAFATITDSTFTDSNGYGASLTNEYNSTMNISGSTFTGNSNSNGAGVIGSGAQGDGGTLTVSDSTFSGNDGGEGGAIQVDSGTGTITDSTFTDNTGGAHAGAIDIADAAADCGACGGTGTVTISGSTFSGNQSNANDGGAILNGNGGGSGAVTVTNSSFSGNSVGAGYGGGAIANLGGTFALTNSTLSGNTAPASMGGGLYNAAALTMGATIVANNTGGDCSGGLTTDLGYNLDDDGTCGLTGTGDLSDTPAGLDPSGLEDNGGPTQTIALEPGSTAIDEVSDGTLCPATDQRGAPRTTPCDIGAYDTDWGPAVELDVSGTQTAGGSTTLSYTTNAPGGTISGTLTCTTVDGGTPISSGLAAGSYTVDGSSCSGLSSSNQAAYPIFPSSYAGVTNGFAVSTTITAVSFGGTVAFPTVTVTGVGFGTLANLGTAQSSCGTGSDYAANLFFTDTTETWNAGEGPPFGSDCIGLTITSYSDTGIVFTFGSQYGTGGALLTGGNSYTVNVLGSTFSGTDTYYPYPVVSEVSPDTGFTTDLTPVTITGSGFTGATAVDFGGVPATNVTAVTDTTITADSPAGSAGAVDVTVTAPGGLSTTSSADQYTYTVDQTIPKTETCEATCPNNTVTSPLNQTTVLVAGPASPPPGATTSLTVNTDTLSCGASKTKDYDYPAAVSTLSTTGFAARAALTVTEMVGNEPSTAGVAVCFGAGANPTKGKFLRTCKPSMKAPCLESLTESGGSVIATLLSPATDPRFWTGEAAADLSSFSPPKGVPGATLTIKGKNLTGIVAVVIGGAGATISSASTAAKLVVTVPQNAAHGTSLITVTSASGEAVSTKTFDVT
jgi:hypothetical protein